MERDLLQSRFAGRGRIALDAVAPTTAGLTFALTGFLTEAVVGSRTSESPQGARLSEESSESCKAQPTFSVN